MHEVGSRDSIAGSSLELARGSILKKSHGKKTHFKFKETEQPDVLITEVEAMISSNLGSRQFGLRITIGGTKSTYSNWKQDNCGVSK